MFYIIATPIGNLEDITLRAIRILKEVDYIAAEDTRHAQILLKKYDIKKPTISFHSWSDKSKLQQLLQLLQDGKNIALVSDAGTPGISDPGYALVKAAIEKGIQIIPIPGPSAFLTALCASGLPTHHFVYYGFLPLKKGRQTLLESFRDEEKTIVFYESPHRIQKTLMELNQKMPDKRIVIARELTKIYEEFFRGTVEEACRYYENKKPRGEYVIILAQ